MKLSIALCTFNGARFLPDQLRSLSEQTRPPDELIACDDGSTDGTIALLREFAATAPFPTQVHVNPNLLGPTRNFDRAFSLCSGDVIFPCDQDDFWLPDKLARMATVLENESRVGLTFSDAWLADANLMRSRLTAWRALPFTPAMRRQLANWGGAEVLARYNVVTGAAMAFRAELRHAILPIPPRWSHDAWTAFVTLGLARILPIPEPLIVYRCHTGQQIGLGRRTLRRQLWAAFAKLDSAYFSDLADRFEVLAERLASLPDADPMVLAVAREKAAFARSQEAMRGMGRRHRAVLAVRHLLAGHYHRLTHGLRSFAVDLLLQ